MFISQLQIKAAFTHDISRATRDGVGLQAQQREQLKPAKALGSDRTDGGAVNLNLRLRHRWLLRVLAGFMST